MNLYNAAICIATASLLAGHAAAQCPSTITNPLNLISGTTWAFLTEDGQVGDATVGIFTATAEIPTRSTALAGVLSITETFNNGDTIGNRVTGTGSYQIYPDCSGGLLTFKLAANGYEYAFVFAPGGTEMYLVTANTGVGITSAGPIEGNRGTAKKLTAPPSCSAFPNPLSALAGSWAFLAQDYASAAVGIFNAQVSPSNLGVLGITATESGADGFLAVQEALTGSYQVYPDCSGGEIIFKSADVGYQYAFVFAGPSEIFMVSNGQDAPNGTYGVYRGNFGKAKKF
jgi:hypothetical protein